MDTIVCSKLCKQYGTKQVLKNIDFTLEKGKIYGLIGRNGAGKTTLLSILSSQNPLSSGSVTWNGEKVWENQRALNHICFSREVSTNLIGNNGNNIKVKEYLKIASYYFPNWDEAMARDLVEKFELDIKKKISKLSKGMLSMVTIIVALASKADFTFLDEPVAGLDIIMREYFYKRLLEEYTQSERTFVISTHIIEEASDLFEEVIFIRKGEILLKENTQELLSRAFRVNGLSDIVDLVTSGFEQHHIEQIGRSKSVTVLLKEGERLPEEYDVTVQPLNLQNLFVALCGMEES